MHDISVKWISYHWWNFAVCSGSSRLHRLGVSQAQKPKSWEMSARGYAFHSVSARLNFFLHRKLLLVNSLTWHLSGSWCLWNIFVRSAGYCGLHVTRWWNNCAENMSERKRKSGIPAGKFLSVVVAYLIHIQFSKQTSQWNLPYNIVFFIFQGTCSAERALKVAEIMWVAFFHRISEPAG